MRADKLEQWTRYAFAIAKEAGQGIMVHFNHLERINPQYKPDQTPVTIADLEADSLIRNALSNYILEDAPVPILSEEAEIPPFAQRQTWSRYWCVDPLDGTRDFVNRTPDFSVNIALIENDRPIIGIIYSPFLQIGYCAWREGGAYRVIENNWAPIKSRGIQKPICVVCSRYGQISRIKTLTAKLGEIELVPEGSALKFARIASGEADLMFRLSPTSEWDNAAGQCILEEAGGGILKLDGTPLRYNCSESLIQLNFVAFGDKNVQWLAYF